MFHAARAITLKVTVFAAPAIPVLELQAFTFRTEVLFSDWIISPDAGSVVYTLNGPPVDFRLGLEFDGSLNPPSQTGFAFGQDDSYLNIFKAVIIPDNPADIGKPVGVSLSYNVEHLLFQSLDHRYSWEGNQQAFIGVLNPSNAGDYIQDYSTYHAFSTGDWFGHFDYLQMHFGPESLYVGAERDFAFRYGTEYTWTIHAQVIQTAQAFREDVPDSGSTIAFLLIAIIAMVMIRKVNVQRSVA